MKTYKLTTSERERIRSWLEKQPASVDIPKEWAFTKDDGSTIQITRTTAYIPSPGTGWKVRIAYIVETGFPILMSGPLQAGKDTKGAPKSTVKDKKALLHSAAKQKAGKGTLKNVAAFEAAVKAELHHALNQPNPIFEALFEPGL